MDKPTQTAIKAIRMHSYVGTRVKDHLGDSGRGGHALSHYSMDRSGSKTYTFNSYGFRGDEPNEGAEKTLFFGGCSHTFGEGLNDDETWPTHFTSRYAQYYGLDRRDVSALNFAYGSSNDHIVRTLMTQATRLKPDLIVCQFTHNNRLEYLLDSTTLENKAMCVALVGPWLAPGNPDRNVRRAVRAARRQPMTKEETRIFSEVHTFAKQYYKKMHYELGSLSRAMKNILLLQMFCESRGIDYYFATVDYHHIGGETVRSHQALGPMYDLINHDRLADFCILDEDIFVDKGADDQHPGPKAAELFAERMWDAYSGVLDPSNA